MSSEQQGPQEAAKRLLDGHVDGHQIESTCLIIRTLVQRSFLFHTEAYNC